MLPPQLMNMNSQYKVMCGCECCISRKSMHYYLLIWSDSCLKHLKDIRQNEKNRRSDEISSRIFETYTNYVQPHGCHMSCSSPRWDNLPSGHQRNPLLGLNLGHMYWVQKHSSE